MKKILTILFLATFFTTVVAQDKTAMTNTDNLVIRCHASIDTSKEPLYVVDGFLIDDIDALAKISPDDIISIEIIKNPDTFGCYGTAGRNGVVVIQTTKTKDQKVVVQPKPFKVYCIKNTNWGMPQDMYNAIQAKVPSLQVSNQNTFFQNPRIRLRGDNVNVVIVDGIRYDTSILTYLNPADIESIKVAPSAAAANYFINGYITN